MSAQKLQPNCNGLLLQLTVGALNSVFLQLPFGPTGGAQNYSTINDLYGTNLNELSAYLTYQVSATGFALGTKGQGVDYQRNSHTVM
uniref:Uncharacterized protein n=1 Tax=Quercus lobata TaxID=97700 RepID=A0A7N2RCZ3_QUELO